MTPQEFATKIRQKYPGSYDGVPDEDLAKRVIAKYPVYASQVKFPEAPKKSLGQRVLDAGTKVADFVGAEGISEQFGASMARVAVPEEQEASVDNPSLKKVIGSAIQTGANFIPGSGTGANLATKVAVGASTGLAFDVGGKLERGDEVRDAIKPGVGTLIGATLPILGNIVGKGISKAPRRLEEISLRMTPTERQNLQKQGKDIAGYLSKKKVVGTPEIRYEKVNTLYNDMENKVSEAIKTSGQVYNRADLVKEIQQIPEQFADDIAGYDEAVKASEKVATFLQKKAPKEIPADLLNKYKRQLFKRAYSKNNTDVLNESYHAVGDLLKTKLDTSIPVLKKLNPEYGKLIAARKILFKATTRSQVGLTGKILGTVGGTAIGAGVGGGIGAAGGAVVGEKIAERAFGTATRSAVGAGFQSLDELIQKLPTDKMGNLQIGKKTLQNLIQKIQTSRQTE